MAGKRLGERQRGELRSQWKRKLRNVREGDEGGDSYYTATHSQLS